MLRLLHALLLSLMISLAPAVRAASIEIQKAWLEHGVTINGKKAMKVHCKFKAHGLKGKKCHMNIWLYDSNSNKIHQVDAENVTRDGDTFFSYDFTPGYDNAVYEDYWYAPYVANMKINPGNSYYVIVTLAYNGTNLAQSQRLHFSATGNANNNSNNNSRNSSGNSSSTVTRTFYTTVGYGGNGAVWVGVGRDDKKMTARFSGNTAYLSGTGLLKDGRTFTYISTNEKGEALYRSEKTLKSLGWKDVMELRIDKSKTHAGIHNYLNGQWSSSEYWVTDLSERRRIIAENQSKVHGGSAPSTGGGGSNYNSNSNNRNNNGGNSTRRESNASRYGWFDCPTCYGTGTCQTCGGSGIASSYTAGGMNCPNCYGNYTHQRSDWGRCGVCNGKGKKYGVVR